MPMKTFNWRCSTEDIEKVALIAKHEKSNKSDILRKMIEYYWRKKQFEKKLAHADNIDRNSQES